MISFNTAQKRIQSEINTLSPITIRIEDAVNYVTSRDIHSPIDMPPFNQSAMDGYAVSNININKFSIVAEIQAGDSGEGISLKEGEAVRIFTGAIVPEGSSAVAKQEIVIKNDLEIELTEKVTKGLNIRSRGEQIEANDIALPAFTVINPGAAGFLYALGLYEVTVFRKPRVTILATGNELAKPGNPLPLGKVYESNTYTLKTALRAMGIDAIIKTAEDDFETIKLSIKNALTENDILITTGGISVGDYDFVGKALGELNVESIFYKVKQKPGKPIFFGKHESTAVFGLPGNPAAALSCFYMYVTPAIRKMMGHKEASLEKRKLSLTSEYKKTNSLSHFLKAKAFGNNVTILTAQSSAMLSSFSEANCLIHMEEEKEEWNVGDLVDAYIFP